VLLSQASSRAAVFSGEMLERLAAHDLGPVAVSPQRAHFEALASV